MKILVVVAVAVVAGFIALFALVISVEQRAQDHAKELCASVKVGDDTSGILERAVASGASESIAKWRAREDGKRELMAIYTGVFPMNRHICTVVAAGNVVVSARYVHLD